MEGSSDVEIKDVTSWSTQTDELEEEWRLCYPPTNPCLVPEAEETGDLWYKGEDCANPSQIAPKSSKAILPAADGSLALKHDVGLPSAPEDRQCYKNHELDRRVFFDKGERGKDGGFKPITAEEARAREARQRQTLAEDEYWQDQVRWSLYQPGPTESPVNFVGQGYMGVMAIPYHVLAPMAWEYPYAFGQAQESVLDRLMMASLYGIKVLRPSYTSATSRPEPIETLDTPEVKKAACSAYVTDTDVSTEVQPSGCLTKVPSRIMAFTCPEEPCGVFHNAGYYFVTVEQWVAHWNTFHVAISPKVNCPETGCPCKIAPGTDSVHAFLRHLTRVHGYLQQDGKWPRLNDIVR